jgi:hypothetical protein
VEFRLNPKLIDQVHRSPQTAAILLAAAQRLVPRVAAATPRDTGETAASTHAEGNHRSLDGKSVAARVVQSGAAVQQQFGNSRERTPARQFDRATGT